MSDAAIRLEADWQRERRWLGYAGYAPFGLCLLVILLSEDRNWQVLAVDTLRHYAAVIASFLGAVHWGILADPRDRKPKARLWWGIMPALIAWAWLALPAQAALLGFAALFGGILWVDRRLLPLLDGPYRRLRTRLTVAVVGTLLIAAAANPALAP